MWAMRVSAVVGAQKKYIFNEALQIKYNNYDTNVSAYI